MLTPEYIVHISGECYPAAKVGGLADVVGALPRYQEKDGVTSVVIMPKYGTNWIKSQRWESVFTAEVVMDDRWIGYSVDELADEALGYKLLAVDIPEYFDRPGVYAHPPGNYFQDDTERYFAFQQAVLIWLDFMTDKPDVVHCHDHHTGLIPFFMKFGIDYDSLRGIKTVFTIHNGSYQGWHPWDAKRYLPRFYEGDAGLMDWSHNINSLSSAVRCADAITTVSESYLEELAQDAALGDLFRAEWTKMQGILNGIDYKVWNPKSDTHLYARLKRSLHTFKKRNKKALCEAHELDYAPPLFTFIGRFADEKGAHLLPDVIGTYLSAGRQANFFILGSGDEKLSQRFHHLVQFFDTRVRYVQAYDEPLAHKLYAASDFLIMPSLVEPCGLNQMYSMHYGTIPVVRAIGGLKDTVQDVEQMGEGLRFGSTESGEIIHTLDRAHHIFEDEGMMKVIRERGFKKNFSWERSSAAYLNLYSSLINDD